MGRLQKKAGYPAKDNPLVIDLVCQDYFSASRIFSLACLASVIKSPVEFFPESFFGSLLGICDPVKVCDNDLLEPFFLICAVSPAIDEVKGKKDDEDASHPNRVFGECTVLFSCMAYNLLWLVEQ